VCAHVRPGQPLKKSGVAGSFPRGTRGKLASATALHIALNPSLTFPGDGKCQPPAASAGADASDC
jgi:hypothetical protein